MSAFKLEDTSLKGAFLIDTFYAEDNRGYFIKDFEKEIFMNFGLDIELFECFESFSWQDVIRGLHFQVNEPQAKLVRAITGEIYDVIVDLRLNSATYGQWRGFTLSDSNRKLLYVPKGFAHGFCVKSKSAIVSYKCVGRYHKGTDSGIVWNDKTLSIDWGIRNPIISERDSKLLTFDEFKLKYNALCE